MATQEGIVGQDADVILTDMQMKLREAKCSEGSDKKNGKEKKKKKEHKTRISSDEETGCEAQPYVKKDEVMQVQKKEQPKFSEGYNKKHNKNREPDSGKKKSKKKKIKFDECGSEEETEPCDKKDKQMHIQMQMRKNSNGKGELGSEEETVHETEPRGKEEEKKDKKKKKIKLEKSKLNEDFSQGEKITPCSINDERKEKKRKRTKSDDCQDLEEDSVRDGCSDRSKDKKKRGKKTKSEKHVEEEEEEDDDCREARIKKKKRNKAKLVECGSEKKVHEGGTGSAKKVSFSDDVEIFPLPSCESSGKTNQDDGLIRGKRFSSEEDEMVKKAVLDYIKGHGLGDEGLHKVLHCKAFPEVKNCWKDIGASLPWRPYMSIYYRAHILFERDENRKWTPEEYELVRNFHEKHGADWKVLAEALGKHRFHVKDTWRRIKLTNSKKGQWSQDEYQNLFDLVNTDLRWKAFEERKSKYGMLRDNICWGAISDKLSTRSTALCCQKWYRQLTSPMVAEGEWADVDDYRLLDALSSLDACSIEDVEWDNVLEHRDGDVCRKRWTQMLKHIGEHGSKSFGEQVEILSNRYCLDVLDAKEAYNSGPIVDQV